jgi:hypothetical protein
MRTRSRTQIILLIETILFHDLNPASDKTSNVHGIKRETIDEDIWKVNDSPITIVNRRPKILGVPQDLSIIDSLLIVPPPLVSNPFSAAAIAIILST